MTLFGRPFRPRLWPSIVAGIMFVVLLGLGGWQVQRLIWKENLIAMLESRWEAAPIPLPQDLSDLEGLQYQLVDLQGRYENDKELYLPGRTYKGTIGTNIVTPFVLEDGRRILIGRGWVPKDRSEAAARPQTLIEGQTSLQGILLPGGWGGGEWFRPNNVPADNVWFYVDPPAMWEAVGGSGIDNAYVAEVRADPEGSLPFTLSPKVDVKNDHLSYALTWFALAIGLAVIYVVYFLGPRPEKEPPEKGSRA